MRYTYDDEADALYIHIDEKARPARSIIVDEDRTVDVDEGGRAVGVELVGVSEGVRLRDLIERFALHGFEERFDALEKASFTPLSRAR
ncbi:MAG: DUF2283 domain-containing protein [Actinomycetota bacterium]